MEALSTFAGGSRNPGRFVINQKSAQATKPRRYDLHNINAEKFHEIDSTRIGSHLILPWENRRLLLASPSTAPSSHFAPN